jgi:hypothetical protein
VPPEKRTHEGHGHFSQDGCRTCQPHALNLRECRRHIDLCEKDNQYYEGNAECRNEKEAFH